MGAVTPPSQVLSRRATGLRPAGSALLTRFCCAPLCQIPCILTLYRLVEADPGRTAAPKISESLDTGRNRLVSWPVTSKPTSPEPTAPGHSLSCLPGPRTGQPGAAPRPLSPLTVPKPAHPLPAHPTAPFLLGETAQSLPSNPHRLPLPAVQPPCLPEWPRVVLLLVLGISEYNKLCLLAVSSMRLLMKT